MFEEICIVCGKELQEDGRAYCSDNCQASDFTSPSVSSSSSALSSPQLGFTPGGDVPALMPSALGSALRKVQQRSPFHLNPSIPASRIRAYGDDDDVYASEYDIPEDVLYDGSSKSANYMYSLPSALSYARRPSGTNTHSTVPQVHQRNKSSSSIPPRTRDRGGPRANRLSQYSSTTTDEDADLSDCSRADDLDSEKDQSNHSETTSAKVRRTRNRASLPACFSLLQIKDVSETTSPVSPVSARTLADPSPPTPRHPHLSSHFARDSFRPHPISHTTVEHDAPRGRQRYADRSKSSRRSPSPRSHSRHLLRAESPRPDQVFDWDHLAPRGRAVGQRVSSRDADRSQSHSNAGHRRGRVSVDELEGVGSFALAPGYGLGRSGLKDRERFAVSRVPL